MLKCEKFYQKFSEVKMDEFVLKLGKIGVKRQCRKGNILFYEGEQAKKFFLLLSGRVRVYKSLSNRELTLHLFEPLNFIAEMPAFRQSIYPASAVCESACELLELEFSAFKRLCERNLEFSILMIGSLLEKIKILEKELSQASASLKERFVRYALDNEVLLPRLSQRQISVSLNTRAESLSRLIKELKNRGLIDTHKGKIQLLNKKGLRDMIL